MSIFGGFFGYGNGLFPSSPMSSYVGSRQQQLHSNIAAHVATANAQMDYNNRLNELLAAQNAPSSPWPHFGVGAKVNGNGPVFSRAARNCDGCGAPRRSGGDCAYCGRE